MNENGRGIKTGHEDDGFERGVVTQIPGNVTATIALPVVAVVVMALWVFSHTPNMGQIKLRSPMVFYSHGLQFKVSASLDLVQVGGILAIEEKSSTSLMSYFLLTFM